MTESVCTYRIDGDDVIRSVDDPWLAFAAENGAPELTREAVEGRSLWAFVAGERTRSLYDQLFQVVRRVGRPSHVPFRCDSPGRLRWMDMEIRPEAGEALEFQCRLLHQESRRPVPLPDPAADDSGEAFLSCSWCRRVRWMERWEDLEEVLRRRRLLESRRLPRLVHTVCPECHEGILREIGTLTRETAPPTR